MATPELDMEHTRGGKFAGRVDVKYSERWRIGGMFGVRFFFYPGRFLHLARFFFLGEGGDLRVRST